MSKFKLTAPPPPRESVIQRAILDALAWRNDVVVWRSNAGAVKTERSFVRFGIPGQADISGVIKPWGTRLEIEVKRPKGRLSEHQKVFRDRMLEAGAVYFVATSSDECLTLLDQAVSELQKRYPQP